MPAASLALLDLAFRESLLFAAIGFLAGGLDDLAIDVTYLWVRATRRRQRVPALLEHYHPAEPRRIVVFVAAWDEATVIGAMLRSSLARFDHPDYRLYVGTYPNDHATINAVTEVSTDDARVRLVVGVADGPTTKADCLNTLWHALDYDERRNDPGDGARAAAIVLHDAEDLVHPGELRVFDALIGRYAVVQLPVLPLVDRGSRLISGHYADEFAESHAKTLVVRQALGASLPLAGVGCAIERTVLDTIARARNGLPFDADSLTEDYELGLHIAGLGGRGVLARVRERAGGPLVATRAYFPATLDAAVRQKARWMAGIALAGWDRVGWASPLALAEHWMRMRDRRAPLAVLVLVAGYAALVAWALSGVLHFARQSATPSFGGLLATLLELNGALLIWRLAGRALFTWRAYGWIEAAWSVPRALVANVVALLAARRALVTYTRLLRGGTLRWDKTPHVFPGATVDLDL